ncbi:MAG: pantetheine-phosphate adenylyltransferase [Zetaproteobacteria bacterium]|nr:pantetheine-phosphate adenylyltransferase [Zetaproteobacteria bacterium]
MAQIKAAFVGSFDPFTRGHLDIVQRVQTLGFDLVVGVGCNPDKPGWIPVADRVQLIQQALCPTYSICVESFAGLAIDFARRHQAKCFIRGVRNATDLELEMNMAWANYDLAPEVDTLVLPPRLQRLHYSSSLVRQIYHAGGDVSSLVPENIYDYLLRMS